ncbi:hypothetical protein ACWEKT_27045 [Nocardia takedensis]
MKESTTELGGGLTVHAAYSGSEMFLMITDEEPIAQQALIWRLSRFTGRVESKLQLPAGLDDLHHSAGSDTKIGGGGLTVRVEYSGSEVLLLVNDEEAPADRRNTILNLNRNTWAIDWKSGRTLKAADKWRSGQQQSDRQA